MSTQLLKTHVVDGDPIKAAIPESPRGANALDAVRTVLRLAHVSDDEFIATLARRIVQAVGLPYFE